MSLAEESTDTETDTDAETNAETDAETNAETSRRMDGTMPEGYEAAGGYYEDCCGSSCCVLGSECQSTIETYVRLGIIRESS